MDFYGQISQQIREIFHRYTPLVEPLSLDEAFLDVRGSLQLFGTSEVIGRRIQAGISAELNLPCSVGVAPNKFLAKLASDLEKPEGFVVVPANEIREFLDPLDIERLWGVGRVTCDKLHQLGVRKIGHLHTRSPEWLRTNLGNVGEHLGNLAAGVDHRDVVPTREAKSISHETTFVTDIEDRDLLRTWLLELTEQVAWRLRKQELVARTVHLKLRYSDFHTITRSISVESPTDVTELFWRTVDRLFCERLPSRRLCVRLIGMGLSGLEANRKHQKMLFGEDVVERHAQLDQVADDIRARFGSQALKRALGVKSDGEMRRRHDETPP